MESPPRSVGSPTVRVWGGRRGSCTSPAVPPPIFCEETRMTFRERREKEHADLEERRRRLTEAANRTPGGRPLYGSEASWGDILGSAEMVWAFREVARMHHLDVTSPRDFQRAQAILDNPDAE